MPSGAPDNPPGSTRSPRGGGSARLAVSLPLLRRAAARVSTREECCSAEGETRGCTARSLPARASHPAPPPPVSSHRRVPDVSRADRSGRASAQQQHPGIAVVSLPAERGPGQRRERRRSEAEPRPPSAESASCEVLLGADALDPGGEWALLCTGRRADRGRRVGGMHRRAVHRSCALILIPEGGMPVGGNDALPDVLGEGRGEGGPEGRGRGWRGKGGPEGRGKAGGRGGLPRRARPRAEVRRDKLRPRRGDM